MRQKIFKILNRIYGIMMTISFFAGFLPLIPYVIAIVVGGTFGETVSVFLYKQYYPVVIEVGSISIIIGLIAMYFGKLEGLSVKKVSADKTSARKK